MYSWEVLTSMIMKKILNSVLRMIEKVLKSITFKRAAPSRSEDN